MNVTALLAHPDDELMCAGTLARFVAEGHTVRLVIGFCSDDDPSIRLEELRASKAAMGVPRLVAPLTDGEEDDFCVSRRWVQHFEEILSEQPPDLLISHRVNDHNTSHGHLGHLARTLARKNRMDLWEIDQSIPGGLTDHAPNHLVDVTAAIPAKWKAIDAYQSQLDKYPGMGEAILHRDRYYGFHIGTAYAEGFTIVRSVL